MKRTMARVAALAVCGMGAALSGCGGGGSSHSQPARLSGKLVFELTRNNQTNIYIANPDGSGQTQLTQGPLPNQDPSLSRDRKRIVWAVQEQLSLMNADGSGKKPVFDPVPRYLEREPAFSPDGSKIAFYSAREREPYVQIYVVGSNGLGVTRLTHARRIDRHPDWSPDGRRIVFETGQGTLRFVNADGTGDVALTQGPSDSQPDWSPDGKKIAFASSGVIFVINVDGTERQRLTSGYDIDSSPAWSPDGTHIAFIRQDSKSIFVMKSDGSELKEVVTQANPRSKLDWK